MCERLHFKLAGDELGTMPRLGSLYTFAGNGAIGRHLSNSSPTTQRKLKTWADFAPASMGPLPFHVIEGGIGEKWKHVGHFLGCSMG